MTFAEQTPEMSSRKGIFTTYSHLLFSTSLIMMLAMTIDVVPDNSIDSVAPVTLVFITILGATRIQRSDYLAAVWAPVLSWFVALMTFGQLTRPSAGSLKEREALLIIHGLADHAWWILGSTIAALAIVLIRHFRLSSSHDVAQAAEQK